MSNFNSKQNKPSVKCLRTIRNPEAWIGKRIPKTYDLNTMSCDCDVCDSCRRWYKFDDLHNILYPYSEFDWWLMKQLHIEEAQGFCPDCLTALEIEAQRICPDWLKNHYHGIDAWADARSASIRESKAVQS